VMHTARWVVHGVVFILGGYTAATLLVVGFVFGVVVDNDW